MDKGNNTNSIRKSTQSIVKNTLDLKAPLPISPRRGKNTQSIKQITQPNFNSFPCFFPNNSHFPCLRVSNFPNFNRLV